MITYAIADLHGRRDLLEKAFEKITIDAASDDYQIVTLGDYIDRGPDSKGVIDLLIKSQEDLPLLCLKGNHEDIMLQTILTPLNPDWWTANGGSLTLKSYGWSGTVSYFAYEVIPFSHINWLENLPFYHETTKQVFVHAGIPTDGEPLDKQAPEKMMWMLYGNNDHGYWKGKHVVHGHHQFEDGPHTWAGRTDLDTFAWKTGRLVIGKFNDTQGPAVDFIEILAK